MTAAMEVWSPAAILCTLHILAFFIPLNPVSLTPHIHSMTPSRVDSLTNSEQHSVQYTSHILLRTICRRSQGPQGVSLVSEA